MKYPFIRKSALSSMGFFRLRVRMTFLENFGIFYFVQNDRFEKNCNFSATRQMTVFLNYSKQPTLFKVPLGRGVIAALRKGVTA